MTDRAPLNGGRMAWLMKAQREAEELVESIRLMVEHDLAITVPDSPDMNALRVIAVARAEAAIAYLGSAMDEPSVQETDSEAFVRLRKQVADTCRGRR